ncbi:MAG: tetratricopeptide repeat protein [Spirochaetota bacterium]
MITVTLPLPPRDELEPRYREHVDTYDKLLYELHRRLRSALKNCGLRSTIKYRVKSFESYYGKLLRILRSTPPESGEVTVTDILALRVVCPFLEDVALAERCIRSQFHVREVDHKGAEFSVREFGYESIHCLIRTPEDLLESFHLAGPFDCEVQIRTILQDAWAEVEHELVYKADFTPFDEAVQRKLAALNANLSLSDITFQEIRDYQRRLHGELKKRRSSFWTLMSETLGEPHPGETSEELLDVDGVTFGVSPGLARGGGPGEERVGPHSVWSQSAGGLDAQLLEGLQAHNEGDFDHADAVYTEILAARPHPYVRAVVHIHRGMARFASSRYRDALTDFTEALELDEGNWRALFYRGTIYRVLGDHELAESDFTACLDRDPYRVECLFQRAALYVQAGRLEEAIGDCDRALAVDPAARAVDQLRASALERQAYGHGGTDHTREQ